MKYINLAKKFAQQKYQQLIAASLMTFTSLGASAAGIEEVGTSAAVEIAKFAIMISAIGAAILSIVVLVQGFVIAFRMIRLGR